LELVEIGRITYDYTGESAVAVEIDGSREGGGGGCRSKRGNETVTAELFRKCTAVRATDLLKACQNLILDERLNVSRFAHLPVEEHLETQPGLAIVRPARPGPAVF